ncbi:hypothetical protein [Winkia neuii]|uniref:hypothetical protein n=1 Tax=Winkia neuii TaxID=33007 RepID=UPI00114D3718|nr:hypothetical protein [Winkia neuii]MDK8100751.1 hypothetical protein [Winkia neuii]
MADLKVDQAGLDSLKTNFESIRNTLSLCGDGEVCPSDDNVGHPDIVQAVAEFNMRVQSTRNKYQKKVENFSTYIDQVSDNTDRADSDMSQTIDQARPDIRTTDGPQVV